MSFLKVGSEILGHFTIVGIIEEIEKLNRYWEEVRNNVKEHNKYMDQILKFLDDYNASKTQIDYKDLIKQEILKNPEKFYNYLLEYDKALSGLENQITSNKSTKYQREKAQESLPNIKKYQYLFVEAFNEAIRKDPMKFEKLYKEYVTKGIAEVRGVDLYNIDDYIRDYYNKINTLKNPDSFSLTIEVPYPDIAKDMNIPPEGMEQEYISGFVSELQNNILLSLPSGQDMFDLKYDSLSFTIGENSISGNMPFKLNYEISATDMTGGLIQQIGEKYSDMSELVVDAVQNIQTFNEEGISAASGADELKQSMNEYKAETYSAEKAIDALNTAFLAMNISGINVPFTTTEESIPFSKSLYDAADACGMLASAFMNVDENIGIR